MKGSGALLLLCVAGVLSGQYLHGRPWLLDTQQASMIVGLLFFVYAVCMVLPFMPAIEVGLVLLAILDVRGVLVLYCVTVAALLISYGVGRMIPVRILKRFFGFLHLHKASELLCSGAGRNEQDQIDRLIDHAPKNVIPFLLRHRYWVFGVAVNTPGNMIMGGAGGIAIMSGMSRLFGLKGFILSVLPAVSPLPVIAILSKLSAT